MGAEIPRSSLRLLIVEDDDGDALLVEDRLEDVAGALTVVRARTLREALLLAPEVDCCLLDLGLPDATGLEAVERMLETAPDVAVVVLTGLTDPAQGIAAVAAGAQDYLAKGEVEVPTLWRAVRYATERRRSERAQRELTVARGLAGENRRLERGLLPRPLVSHPGLRLGSGYRPGRERALLGGDFYDAVESDDGALHLLIGDVSGHGPDEAALGVALRIAWRTLILAGSRGPATLERLQEILVYERHLPDAFATVAVAEIAPSHREAVLLLAGHPAPVLLTETGAPRRLEGDVGLPLGALDDGGGWTPRTLALPQQWGLVLHTDGLLEGPIGTGRFGDERLIATIAEEHAVGDWRQDPQQLVDRLLTSVSRQLDASLLDDSAVLLATFAP